MADILLCTINAKYLHASLGLRFVHANLGALQQRAKILEVTAQDGSDEIVERILRHAPRIVGLGVYIWNARQSEEVVALLKQLRPDIAVVIGGPEVSFESEQQPITARADHVISGEGEVAFRNLCEAILSGGDAAMPKYIDGGRPPLEQIALPYDLYDEDDVAHRLIYVESSRGCPFGCEFCLSALDERIRRYPLEPFLEAMQRLLDRGVRHFKFVDRTFNLDISRATRILRFFAERSVPDLSLHFEMIPDRLPGPLKELLAAFPPGSVQLEVGLQTFSDEVAARIGRRQDAAQARDNIAWLRAHTGVHLHTDLIVGLPGEDVTSFARGFDDLVALDPQEIQVGILKRLRGTPIARHTEPWGMAYRDRPPYDVLHTNAIDYETMQRLKRFGHTWGTVVNNGRLPRLSRMLIGSHPSSPFERALAFSDWLYERAGRVHSIAFDRLAAFLLEFGTQQLSWDADEARHCLARDYEEGGRRLPARLRPAPRRPARLSRRQKRHAAGDCS